MSIKHALSLAVKEAAKILQKDWSELFWSVQNRTTGILVTLSICRERGEGGVRVLSRTENRIHAVTDDILRENHRHGM